MTVKENPSPAPFKEPLSLVEQVALDLSQYLDVFPNKTFALRNLAKETGLNQKTLRRLLNKENNPSNQTLFKLYYVFTQADKEEEVLEHCPLVIKKQLKSYEFDTFEKLTPREFNFKDVLKSDPIIGEIYLLLGTKEVDMSYILYHYGQYGARALEKIEKLGLAHKVDNGLYKLTPKQPYLNAELLKLLGLRMTRTFFKTEEAAIEGSNFIGLYAESLSREGKKKWLEIDQRAFNEKVALVRDPQNRGEEPVYTFMATDSFENPTSELP